VNGLDFQRELVARGIQIPIIFITGHRDIPGRCYSPRAWQHPGRRMSVLIVISASLSFICELGLLTASKSGFQLGL
jgi:hypothetical protein